MWSWPPSQMPPFAYKPLYSFAWKGILFIFMEFYHLKYLFFGWTGWPIPMSFDLIDLIDTSVLIVCSCQNDYVSLPPNSNLSVDCRSDVPYAKLSSLGTRISRCGFQIAFFSC
jgi:hypothetical protein